MSYKNKLENDTTSIRKAHNASLCDAETFYCMKFLQSKSVISLALLCASSFPRF